MVRVRTQPKIFPKGNVVVVKSTSSSNNNEMSKFLMDAPCCAQEMEKLRNDSNAVAISSAAFHLQSTSFTIPRIARYLKSSQKEFDLAKTTALEAFNKVIARISEVQQQQQQDGSSSASSCYFFDRDFFPGYARTLYPAGTPQESCTVGVPSQIIRASTCYKQIPATAQLFNSDSSPSPLFEQGQLGDGHLLAAMNLIGKGNVKKLFVGADVVKGVYAVCFFANGIWGWTIVDDLIPADANGNPLFFNFNKNPSGFELYPIILEKAFAKFHGSYDAIDGGFTSASVLTLFGSTTRMTLDMKKISWGDLKSFLSREPQKQENETQQKYVVSASLKPTINSTSNTADYYGIPNDRSYQVVDVKEDHDRGIGWIKLKHLLPYTEKPLPSVWKSPKPGTSSTSSQSAPTTMTMTAPTPTCPEDITCFFIPAFDFRQYFVCDVVPVTESQLTYVMEGTYGKGHNDDDGIFMIKLHNNNNSNIKNTKLRISVGQLETRFVENYLNSGQCGSCGGDAEANHLILKGTNDWALKSFQLGVRVFCHTKGIPDICSFPLCSKKEVASRVVENNSESVFVEVELSNNRFNNNNNNGETPIFFSVTPICDVGTPYHVRIENISPPSANPLKEDLTLFRLSQALLIEKNSLGRREGVKLVFENPDELNMVAAAGGCGDGDDDDDDDNDQDEDDPEEMFWLPEGQKRNGPSRQALRAMFDQFDMDGSNYLDKTELVALFLHFFPKLGPKAVSTKIKSVDADSDGKISFREFRALSKEIFS